MLLMLFFLGLTFGSMTVRAENISGTDNNEINVDPTGNGEGYAAVVYKWCYEAFNDGFMLYRQWSSSGVTTQKVDLAA